MNILIAIVTALVVLWVFYRCAVRKVLIDMQRFKIFELRDKVRMMSANGEISAESAAFQYIERMLCCLARDCEKITLSKFVEAFVMGRVMEEPVESKRFNENAPNQLKVIVQTASAHFLLTMFANSPAFSILLIIAVIAADAFGRIKNGWNKWMQTNTLLFVENRIFRDGITC